MDLADAVCRKASVDMGDRVKLILKIASEELPAELAQLIEKEFTGAGSLGAAYAWSKADVA
jgi:hypothetical protein